MREVTVQGKRRLLHKLKLLPTYCLHSFTSLMLQRNYNTYSIIVKLSFFNTKTNLNKSAPVRIRKLNSPMSCMLTIIAYGLVWRNGLFVNSLSRIWFRLSILRICLIFSHRFVRFSVYCLVYICSLVDLKLFLLC